VNYWAVIPAAGVGKRMQQSYPKQYLPLRDKPILQHTLERLDKLNLAGIAVAISDTDSYWRDLDLQLSTQLIQVQGGRERFHSVFNCLEMLQKLGAQPQDWVLVHDAVRPCVRQADIEKLMTTLATHSVGGLLALPVRDTMKRADANNNVDKTICREGLWHALTPQMFRLEILKTALDNVLSKEEAVTDDAQAVEMLGHTAKLVEGHADNIKITYPQDLQLAELFLQQQDEN